MADPETYQEAHSPTQQTTVVLSQSPRRTTAGPRRRILDARLWDGLTEPERRAALEIDRAWRYHVDGLTARAQGFERVDKGRGQDWELTLAVSKTYDAWRRQLADIERYACLYVVCDNKPMKWIAGNFGRANHWPRQNLGRCLNLWAEIRGFN